MASEVFGVRLAAAVTAQCRRASGKRGYNPHALGLMLGAAHECEAAVVAGADPARAFAEHFTPTRENHAMARKLELTLDVQRDYRRHSPRTAPRAARPFENRHEQ